jgi:hypothetical protein
MKSLAERHEDRANRKFENAAESTAGNISGRVANAGNLMEQAQTAYAGLSEAERAELRDAYAGADPVDGFRSLAEDDSGNFKYAGIGIVNPLVVPAADAPAPVSLSELEARAGNGGGGWGDGNANGRAVDAAAAPEGGSGQPAAPADGWGAPPAGSGTGEGDGKPTVTASMKVADLEAIAKDEGVDLEGATNNDQRVERILAKRATPAGE